MRVTVEALASESVEHQGYDPVTPLRGLRSRTLEAAFTQNWGMNAANGTIHNGRTVETTHMSTDKWRHKMWTNHLHAGILRAHKKE